MPTMKMIAIVALTALSFGTGAAMAQSEVAGETGVPYWTLERQQANATRQTDAASLRQAGSPDIEKIPSRTHVLPFNGDYSNIANPN